MGLVTLILLSAFTMLYLSKIIKSNFIIKIVSKIEENLDSFTMFSAIYGAVGVVVTIVMAYSGADMFIRVAANSIIVMLSLPFVFDRISLKMQGKSNPIIIKELGNIIKFVTRNEKIFGFIAGIISVLLFGIMFK